MNLRGLILLALAVCLCTANVHAAKMDGEIRATNGQEAVGWARFDTSAIPDTDTVISIDFHFYVNATYYPYWMVTPLTNDPLTADDSTLYADIVAEMSGGEYNYLTEDANYAPGWKQFTLGSPAAADLQARLTEDWFPLGIVDTDGGTGALYYLYIDGRTDTNPPYLVVTHASGSTTCLPSAATYATGTIEVETIGACCFSNGACAETTETECISFGGTFQGVGTDCISANCPLPECNNIVQDLGDIPCPGSLTVSGDTSGATNYCGYDSGDAHFMFTALDDGDYTFTTCSAGTDFDTVLRLFNDVCCGNVVTSNDQDPNCADVNHSTMTVTLQPGSYYLQVEGYSTEEGNFDLAISCAPPPDCNDDLVDLGPIACPTSMTVSGDTTGAPNSCGNASGDAHYTFTVPDGGLYTFTTCNAGTAYDTYLRLYDDACCGNQIYANDDDSGCPYTYRSTLADIPLVPGQYYLQVEGYSADEGYFELNISGTVPPGPTTLSLSPDKDCYQINDTVVVDIDLVTPTIAIVGGQFFLEYDTTALDFVSVAVGDAPFDNSIWETVDEVAGTIDYAVHAPFASGGTIGDTTMARLTFTALRQICADPGVITFRPHEPPTTLSDYHGLPAPVVLVDLDLVDTEAPVLACPANVTVECDQPTDPAPGWNHKMHFPQEPDPLGWDINADYDYFAGGIQNGRIVADDWLCTETGQIEQITIWGSWQGDSVGTIPNLYFWAATDVPAGDDAPYSHPDMSNLFWQYSSMDGEFTVTEVFPSSDQGWFDPIPDVPDFTLNDHQRYFRYEIPIPPGSTFQQNDGTIYWLIVSAATEPDGVIWGMKTSTSHWNDHAVYWDTSTAIIWSELSDPVTSGPLDLAFVVGNSTGTGGSGVGQATAIDNCDPAPVITWSDSIAPGACPQEQVITRTWTATDHCGNSSSCVQTITVVDTTPPTITCPAPVNVQCIGDVPAPDTGSVTTADNCDMAAVVTHMGDVSDGLSCPETITRTYRATDACGNFAECTQLISVDDTMPPSVACPADIVVSADAGGCDAVVSWPAPMATDNCDPSPSVICVPAPGSVFSGTTTVTCTATDDCGNSNVCTFNVTVNPVNDLLLDLALSPTMDPAVTRCITLDLWNCTSMTSVTQEEVVAFSSGTASLAVEVPCGDYDCITVRDKLHTLSRTLPLGTAGTAYAADFVAAAKPLVNGNLNDDEWIDIIDFGVLNWQFYSVVPGSTDCATAYPHVDIDGDGVVDSDDFSFIQINFLEGSDAGCCGGPAPLTGPVTSISVKELIHRGMGELAAADLNGDGMLDTADVQAFMLGERPRLKPAELHGLKESD